MPKILLTWLFLCSLLFNTAWAADFSHLIILHTNDTHGFDQRAPGINGLATVAALKKDYRAKGYDVLLVDAGDAIQDNNLVNFSKGKSAIIFFNACGYDAMTLGNHEFDYGQDVTLQRVKEAKFPVVNANIIVEATGKNFIPKDTIIKKGKVKIGIFGLTTPETIVSTNPKNIYGLKFLRDQELYNAAQEEAVKLRSQGCDLVICLAHLGSEEALLGNRSNDVLSHVHGIDILIDGHDHTVKNLSINGTLLVETGYYTKNIGIISHTEQGWQSKMLPYGEFNQEDPKIKNIVAKAVNNVQKNLSKKIGVSQINLDGKRYPGVRNMETNLGDFVADAYLWQASKANVLKSCTVDAAIVNGGGLRASIPAGPVTLGSITAVAPYNNQIYIMKLKGTTLLEILEAATCTTPEPLGAFPQVAGLKYTVNTQIPFVRGKQYPHSAYYAPATPGSRVTLYEVAGKPFDPEADYTIATQEFICRGGDAYGALTLPGTADIHSIGYIDTEAMCNYIKEELHGVIGQQYANSQGRILIK